jgi:hypothetical protein
MSTPEAFIPLNGSAGNSAPVTGGRRHKLKLVTRKQARKMLKKLGAKMRGGQADAPGALVTPPATGSTGSTASTAEEGGRRRRGTKKASRKSRRSLFGLKY